MFSLVIVLLTFEYISPPYKSEAEDDNDDKNQAQEEDEEHDDEDSEDNDNEESCMGFPRTMGTGEGDSNLSITAHPSSFWKLWKSRVPRPDEYASVKQWPGRYLIVTRGSRVGIFPDL